MLLNGSEWLCACMAQIFRDFERSAAPPTFTPNEQTYCEIVRHAFFASADGEQVAVGLDAPLKVQPYGQCLCKRSDNMSRQVRARE